MDRVKKKPSVVTFIFIYAAIFFIVAIVGMSALTMFTTRKATIGATENRLAKEAMRASYNLEIQDDGNIAFLPGAVTNNGGCYALIVKEDGSVIAGEYPGDMAAAATAGVTTKRRLMHIETEDGVCCYYDKPIMRRSGEKADKAEYYVRTMIDYREIDTIYQDIQKFLYIYVIILLCIMSAGGYLLYRKVVHPVNAMCERINSITESLDLSERIEDPGAFRETEVITNANNRLIEQAEEVVLQQEEFNQNISHELRTPVSLIQGECELLEDMYVEDLPEAMAEAVSVIHKQSERMNLIISELLYLAKINSDGYKLNREKVDLVDIVESACDDAEDFIDGGREFVRDFAVAEAEVDVGLFMIAVRNLLSNAIKYSPRGSRIYVSTGVMCSEAYVSVRDEGCGISEENQKKVFEPYYQVNGERNSDGFGLGLNLVKRIAEKHGGSVKLTSALNEGATFAIVLPAVEDSHGSS
ncbi:MAG: HAMP domain-containing histidine kinase [Firmicutes bacterium]|nr:HAMP domain-containing histidine kinase [Bacillota bacterium]